MSLDWNTFLNHFTVSDFNSLLKKLGLVFMSQTKGRVVLDKNEMEQCECFKQFKNTRTNEFMLTKDDILFSLPKTVTQIPSKVELPIVTSNSHSFLLRADETIFYSHSNVQMNLTTKKNEKKFFWKQLLYMDPSCHARLVELLQFCEQLVTEPAKYANMNYAVFPNDHFIDNVCIGQLYQAEIPDFVSSSPPDRYAYEPDREELLQPETLFAEKKAAFFDQEINQERQRFIVDLKFNFCFDESALESSMDAINKPGLIQKTEIEKYGDCDHFSPPNPKKNVPVKVEQLVWKHNRFMASSSYIQSLSSSKIVKQSQTKSYDAYSNQHVKKFKSDIRSLMVNLLKKPVPNLTFTLPKNVSAFNAASGFLTDQKRE